MPARGESDAVLSHPLEVVPIPCIRNRQGARDIDAVDRHVEFGRVRLAADIRFNLVGRVRSDVDCVFEPFARFEIVQDECARMTGDVNVFIRTVCPALIAGCVVVIRDALAAIVKVLGLKNTWNGERRSEVRRLLRRLHDVRHGHRNLSGYGRVASRIARSCFERRGFQRPIPCSSVPE